MISKTPVRRSPDLRATSFSTQTVFKSSRFEIAGPEIGGVTLIVFALWLLSLRMSGLFFRLGFKSSDLKSKIEDRSISFGAFCPQPSSSSPNTHEAHWRALLNGTGCIPLQAFPHRVEMIIWAFAGLKSGRRRPAPLNSYWRDLSI